MKKLIVMFLTLIFTSLTACNTKTANEFSPSSPTNPVNSNTIWETEKSPANKASDKNTKSATLINISSPEALIDLAENDVSTTIALLYANLEKLTDEIDTYKKYKNNVDKIESFYDNVLATQQQLSIRLREYCYKYAELVVFSDESYSDKYDALDELYDTFYDDLCEEIYDEIYDGVLDDLYDAFYDGVIDDAYDTVPYKEWHDVHSDEYGLWRDARSDSYHAWTDMRSDIYGFWSDMRSKMWSDDIAGATKKMNKFLADIEKLKGKVY